MKSNIHKAGDRDQLVNGMEKERSGIIKLMINDYIELLNKHNGAIPQSEECKKEKLNYREQNDILGEFIRANCIVDSSREDYYETLTDLAEAYAEFVGIKSVSSTFITRQLLKYDKRIEKNTRKVFRDEKSKNARVLQFIKLKTFSVEEEEPEFNYEEEIPDDEIPF